MEAGWFLWATSLSFNIELGLYWAMLVAILAIPYFNNYDHVCSLFPFLWQQASTGLSNCKNAKSSLLTLSDKPASFLFLWRFGCGTASVP
ncbi:hypothetical protein [Chloroflexus sp.]